MDDTLKEIFRRLDKIRDLQKTYNKVTFDLLKKIQAFEDLLSGKNIVDVPGEDYGSGHDKLE